LRGQDLDLILHSPGGSPEAAEAIVNYIRSKFQHVRVIVAMSAATMVACSGNVIVMGKHSSLGPIDPQLVLQTSIGIQMVPAQAILDQFEQAKRECADPAKLAAWMPMLGQYGPHLLVFCQNALKMAQELVRDWLKAYMFIGDPDKTVKARKLARWLADHGKFKSHGRHISRETAREKGLIVENLEDDQVSQDLFLSVFHATTHTFDRTTAVKIIENHAGKAYIKQFQMVAR